jgi:hypothetical protein
MASAGTGGKKTGPDTSGPDVEPEPVQVIDPVLRDGNRSERRHRRPSFKDMKNKRARREVVTMPWGEEDWEFELQALGGTEMDDLVSEFPPTQLQRAKAQALGQTVTYNIDVFAPELLSRVIIDPKLTAEEWTEIWKSNDWAGGEIGDLFYRAQRICGANIDIPFNGAG